MEHISTRFRSLFTEAAPELGFFQPGRLNAITDVPGVGVGHATLHSARRQLHTGVTAIWPRADVYDFRPYASGHVLHGAGEMTGLHQVLEWGLIETPILLTSTLNVGRVLDATTEYLLDRHPKAGLTEDVLIPVVAECDDSHLNRARARAVSPREVRRALDEGLSSAGGRSARAINAKAWRGGVVAEGSVGAGAGMMAFDFKGGIGTASRRVPVTTQRGPAFHVGVLLNANLGVRRQLRVAGQRIGAQLTDRLMPDQHPERSVIVVLATDAPLRPDQLRRLCVRAGLGLGRAGSFASHGSGELILGFSTSAGQRRQAERAVSREPVFHDSFLSPFYEAAVECVEEAVLNALTANADLKEGFLSGRSGHRVYGLPVEELRSRLLF